MHRIQLSFTAQEKARRRKAKVTETAILKSNILVVGTRGAAIRLGDKVTCVADPHRFVFFVFFWFVFLFFKVQTALVAKWRSGLNAPHSPPHQQWRTLVSFEKIRGAHFSPEVSAAFMNLRDSRAEPGLALVPSLTVLRILGGGVNKVH